MTKLSARFLISVTKNRFSRVTYSFRSTICQTTEVDVQLCKMKMFYTRTKYMNLEPGLNSEPGLMVYTGIHRLMYCAFHLYHCMFPEILPFGNSMGEGGGGAQKAIFLKDSMNQN